MGEDEGAAWIRELELREAEGADDAPAAIAAAVTEFERIFGSASAPIIYDSVTGSRVVFSHRGFAFEFHVVEARLYVQRRESEGEIGLIPVADPESAVVTLRRARPVDLDG